MSFTATLSALFLIFDMPRVVRLREWNRLEFIGFDQTFLLERLG